MPPLTGYKGSGKKKSGLSKPEQKKVQKAFKKRAPLRKALGIKVNKKTGKPSKKRKKGVALLIKADNII